MDTKIALENNPLPELMIQCSCSVCNYTTCFSKRHDHPCNCKSDIDNCSLVDSLVKNIDNFDTLNIKEVKENDKKERHGGIIDAVDEAYKNDRQIEKDQIKNDKRQKIKETTVYLKEQSGEKIKPQPKEKAQYMINNTLTNSSKKLYLSRAKLSAQIMNVPYKDLEYSMSQYKPKKVHNVPTMSLCDVVQRIKEVYKACSCKVCECIIGKSFNNEICNCKPCDCDDCSSFNKRSMFSRTDPEFIQWSEIGKSEIKGDCNCVPCECIESTDSTPTSCACEPCQCIECKPYKHYRPLTLVVAPVGDDNQTHRMCQCSPCECNECTHRFGITSNTMRHDMSTGLNRHQHCHCDACLNETCLPDNNDTCRCEIRDRVMRKPVQRDNEYDIRRAQMALSKINELSSRQHMVAMYATISNRYSNYRCSSTKCDCSQCECLYCRYNDSAYSVKSNRLESNKNLKMPNGVNCACTVCECEFCTKDDNAINQLPNELRRTHTVLCSCKKCKCIKCDIDAKQPHKNYLNTKTVNTFHSKKKCTCRTCECADCDRAMFSCTGDICDCTSCKCVHCVANVTVSNVQENKEKLTPANSKNKIKCSFINLIDKPLREKSRDLSSVNQLHDEYKIKFFAHDSLDDNYLFDYKKRSSFDEPDNDQQLSSKAAGLEHLQRTNCLEWVGNTTGRVDNVKINKIQACESSGSCYNSGMQSEHRYNSSESLCDHSDYKCTSYQGNSSKTLVETCLKNTMKLNLIDSEKLNSLGMTSQRIAMNRPLSFLQSFRDNIHTNNDSHHKSVPLNNTYCRRKIEVISYDESSLNKKHGPPLQQTNVSIQCCFVDVVQKNTWNTQRTHLAMNNDLSLDKDYSKAQNTLAEARQFSQQLLSMLATYDKANREFQSVSQKLKEKHHMDNSLKNIFLHNSAKITTNGNDCNVNEKLNFTDDIPVKDLNYNACAHYQENISAKVDFSLETNEIKLSPTKLTMKRKISDSGITKYIQDPLQHNHVDLNNPVSNGFFDCKVDLNHINEDNELSSDSSATTYMQQTMRKKILRRNDKMNKRTGMVFNRAIINVPKVKKSSSSSIHTNTSEKVSFQDAFINTERENYEVNMSRTCNKEQGQSMKTNNKVRKYILEKNGVSAYFTNIPLAIKQTLSDRSQADAVILTSPTNIELQIPKQAGEVTSATVLMENFCLNAKRNNTTLNKAPTDVEIKKAKSILCQYCPSNHKSPESHENRALASHTRDAMKVSFLTVRKVSDHTVMVKWNAPRALQNVQGYELLVDGRAVQKILNVSRCMAVVTCVPNADKILITVRTVTDPPCTFGHSPSTTVIYRNTKSAKIY